MKLWEKGIATDKQIEHFTVGNDRELDLVLAKYDALGSIAHAKMLGQIGLLTAEETTSLVTALEEIIKEVEAGKFEIEDSFEDVHSKIEYLLTIKLGDAGKKIHTARSRNDRRHHAIPRSLDPAIPELSAVLFDDRYRLHRWAAQVRVHHGGRRAALVQALQRDSHATQRIARGPRAHRMNRRR